MLGSLRYRAAPMPAVPRSAPADHDDIARSFDRFAAEEDRWRRRTAPYHDFVRELYGAIVAPGQSVLEIGCGQGDLLASLQATPWGRC